MTLSEWGHKQIWKGNIGHEEELGFHHKERKNMKNNDSLYKVDHEK